MSKILVIKLRALGDTVLMSAPVLELIRGFPTAKVDVLVHDHWSPIWEGHPGVRKVWSYHRHKDKIARMRTIARLGYQLRKEKYDMVINFHASPSSALIALATGAPVRSIHFHGHRHKNRYSTVQIPGKGVLKPNIERDMDAVRAVGLQIPPGKLPILPVQHDDYSWANSLFIRRGLDHPILAISLGSSRPTKSWPIEKFAKLATRWCETERGTVLALASPAEENLILQFLRDLNQVASPEIQKRIFAMNNFEVRELFAVLSQVDVLVCNDSGPKHLAVAARTPTVTLFGPEDPFEWHPYPIEEHPFHFIPDLKCRKHADPGMPPWCGLYTCTLEKHRCMNSIDVEPVLADARKLLISARKS